MVKNGWDVAFIEDSLSLKNRKDNYRKDLAFGVWDLCFQFSDFTVTFKIIGLKGRDSFWSL